MALILDKASIIIFRGKNKLLICVVQLGVAVKKKKEGKTCRRTNVKRVINTLKVSHNGVVGESSLTLALGKRKIFATKWSVNDIEWNERA